MTITVPRLASNPTQSSIDAYNQMPASQLMRFGNRLQQLVMTLYIAAIADTGQSFKASRTYDPDDVTPRQHKKLMKPVIEVMDSSHNRIFVSVISQMRSAYESGSIPAIAPTYIKPVLKGLVKAKDKDVFAIYIDHNFASYEQQAYGLLREGIDKALNAIALGLWDDKQSVTEAANDAMKGFAQNFAMTLDDAKGEVARRDETRKLQTAIEAHWTLVAAQLLKMVDPSQTYEEAMLLLEQQQVAVMESLEQSPEKQELNKAMDRFAEQFGPQNLIDAVSGTETGVDAASFQEQVRAITGGSADA